MNIALVKTIFSRLLMVGAVIAVLAFAYLLIGVALAPVPVPPPAQVQKSVTFDPRLDVTKNSSFTRMRPLGIVSLDVTNEGRANPFLPAPTSSLVNIPVVTSTALVTTTAQTTSTR